MRTVVLAPRWLFWARLEGQVVFWLVVAPLYWAMFCAGFAPWPGLAGTAVSIPLVIGVAIACIASLWFGFLAFATAVVRVFDLDATTRFDREIARQHSEFDRRLDPDRYRDYPDGVVR